MVEAIAALLLIAWLCDIAGIYAVGPFGYALMIIAIVLCGVGLVRGRRKLA